MDGFIEKYRKSRKQKFPLLVDFCLGLLLLIYTIVYSCTSLSDDVWGYILIFIILFSITELIRCWIKLFLIYNYNYNKKICLKKIYKLNVKRLYKLYNQKVDSENFKYIEDNFMIMSSEQQDIFCSYLYATKSNIEFFKFKDIVLMGISFALGASFDDNSLINANLLTNALNSVLGCFLGLTPFYLIFYRINMAYRNLFDDNIIKSELIEYISKIRFNNINDQNGL